MGIKFFVNPSNTPIVTKAEVEGRAADQVEEPIELDFTPLYQAAEILVSIPELDTNNGLLPLASIEKIAWSSF